MSEELESTGTNGTTEPDKDGLLAALKAERAKRQEFATQLEALKAEQEAAAQKAAEEAGEHKRLYDDIKPKFEALTEELNGYRQREAQRVEALTAKNTERVATLAEHLKPLVPPNLDPDALSAWLDKAASIAPPTRPAGTQTGTQTASIPQECIDEAKRLGIDPEKWFHGGWKLRNKKS